MKVDGDRVIDIDRNMETVIIPTTARFIGQFACINGLLTILDLECSNINIIEEYAFSYCYKLKEVMLPSCLQEICEGAFSGCYGLAIIKLESDSKLSKIGAKAFKGCYALKKFEFPPLIEVIGESAFMCTNIFSYDLRETQVRQIDPDSLLINSCIALPATVTPKSIYNCCGSELDVDDRHQFAKRDECGCFNVNRTIIDAKKGTIRFLIRRGVERIGKYCFSRSNLVSLTIPSSVAKISKYAFLRCEKLKFVHFSKNSHLETIGIGAFTSCESLRKIKLPKSLKVIRTDAFRDCTSLESVSFPFDSQLERIEEAFQSTKIKHLSLPPSIREIDDVKFWMDHVETVYIRNEIKSVHVKNDLYSSNETGNAIFNNDGSEIICVVRILKRFEIPDGVRIIRKNALRHTWRITIPASVETIEERAFACSEALIKFAPGSKLRSLSYEAFASKPKNIIINNENFVTMDNGVVMSLNPRGIVFVPDYLVNIDIDPNVEVIYSCAFSLTDIKSLSFTKSLKKIFSFAFCSSRLEYITFEKGTDLETIGTRIFGYTTNVGSFSLLIKGKTYKYSPMVLELPENFSPEDAKGICPEYYYSITVSCPRSSLLALVKQWPQSNLTVKIVDDIPHDT